MNLRLVRTAPTFLLRPSIASGTFSESSIIPATGAVKIPDDVPLEAAALVVVIVAGLAVGSLLLLPSIILGYAVKAAEREDRERGE